MRILLTRTVENNERTALQLNEQGFEAVSLSLGQIIDIGPNIIEFGEALIFTSSAAINVLSKRGVKGNRSTEVFCVGERTQKAALEIGFESIVSVAGCAEDLAENIKSHYADGSMELTYLAGRDRSFDFSRAFSNMNTKINLVELYDVERLVPDKTEMENALLNAKGGVQLHYSALSARYFFDLVKKYELTDLCKTMDAITISKKTYPAVDKSLVKSVQNAKIASEAGLIDALKQM